jgi:hypothetical protein
VWPSCDPNQDGSEVNLSQGGLGIWCRPYLLMSNKIWPKESVVSPINLTNTDHGVEAFLKRNVQKIRATIIHGCT